MSPFGDCPPALGASGSTPAGPPGATPAAAARDEHRSAGRERPLRVPLRRAPARHRRALRPATSPVDKSFACDEKGGLEPAAASVELSTIRTPEELDTGTRLPTFGRTSISHSILIRTHFLAPALPDRPIDTWPTGLGPTDTGDPLTGTSSSARPATPQLGQQLRQQQPVQLGPDPGLGPLPQPAPGGDAGTAHGLGGDVTPGDTRPQHVHDAGESGAVGDTRPPPAPRTTFGGGRQQRRNPLPQFI